MFNSYRNDVINILTKSGIIDFDKQLNDGSKYELEAKFTSYDYKSKKIISKVSNLYYLRLIGILDKDNNYDKKIEKSDVMLYDNSIRKIVIDKVDDKEIVFEQKTHIGKNIDINDYDIRISLNKEKLIDEKKYNLIPLGITRGRIRHSYFSKDLPVTIDITQVTQETQEIDIKGTKEIDINYEVEVEFHGSKSEIDIFFDEIEKVFKLMKATENVYSNDIKNKLDNDISVLLKVKPEIKLKYQNEYGYHNKITSTTLVKARNIKYRDLVYGGIVGNVSVTNENVLINKSDGGTDYYITYKADGIRKYLIIHDTGIWLVYPKEEYNLVITPSKAKIEYSNFIKAYKDSVFDSELIIPKINEKNIQYSILAFDCLLLKGITKENLSYTDRLNICKNLVEEFDKLNDNTLSIDTKKSYILPENPESFFSLIKDLYDNRKLLNYDDDGFIFTPDNVIYNPRSQKIKFKVSEGNLHVLNKGKEVIFRGSNKKLLNYPKDTNVEFIDKLNNTIVEYNWNGRKLLPIKEAKKGEQADSKTSVFKIWDGVSFNKSNTKTIRFKVENDYLYILDENKTYVRFTGSSKTKLNYPRDSNVEFLPNFNNSIVEYYWNGNKLVPIKKVNEIDNEVKAIKIWNDMISPDVASDKLLTNTPDVCKWKHPEDLTIDFQIKIKANDDGSRRLELYVFDGSSPVIFTGTERYPLVPENVRMKGTYFSIDEINHNNKIIEFEWIKENKRTILQPRKYRTDKINPNQKIVAEDVWEDIMDPIFIEDLIGETPELAIKYHNTIKGDLYFNVGKKYKKNFTLLDIGSGRGGDIGRWNKFNGNIIAVEPYKPNRDELARRLNKSGIKDRVTIVPSGGEDTVKITEVVRDNIPEGKVDVVSLMLSMSFFWSSDKHLDALVRTIVTNLKPGGQIIFLTIDGNSLEETFKNSDEKTIAGARIHLYPSLGPQWGRPVDFELPGSIIEEGGQREYVVRLDDFSRKLSKFGFISTMISKAIKPKLLLSREQILYSSLYSYGSYTNIDDFKLEEFDSNIELPKLPDVKTSYGPAIETLTSDFDDAYAPVKCSWSKKEIVRIAVIGGENTFIHAVLKCIYKKYQNNDDFSFRSKLANNVRHELVNVLDLDNENFLYPDPESNYSYWQTVGNGLYPRLVMKGLNTYSLEGLSELLNSREYLDNNIYELITEVFKINIYIVKITKDDIEYVISAICKVGRPNIVISGDENHFEVVAVNDNGLFQTVFDDNEKFIKDLELKSPKNKIENKTFDPDETFINDFINIFTTYGIFTFPEEIYDIYTDPDDPFIQTLDRLKENIIELTKFNKR